MRKFLAVLMAVFMLAATLAVLPISAAEAVTTSNKDGSTAADADAIDLVITEVLADTKSNNISLQTKNAYQYIEIYNRGDSTVNIYDYAIVRATYKEKDKQGAWPDPKKFDKKIVLDPGSIYAYYQEKKVPNIGTYATSALNCVNADNGDIAPGQTALIWFWNDDTKSVISANGGTAGAEAQGLFNNFKNHYADMGTTIPEDVKIFATFGVDGIGQSFQLNVSANYVYALVKDNEGANGFDVSTEVAYSQSTGGNFTRNDKIVAMFKFGTSLGYYSTTENAGAIYTLASKVPQYNNKKNDNNDTNYFEAGKVDSFKEMGCIFFEEAMTPGKLLPIQWADLDPDRAPADVKGTDADWTAKVWAAYLAVALPDEEITNREEVDKNQSNIDVDRDDLGNQGQNKLGEWTYFQGEDGNYYRYKTEGGDKDSAVKVDKAEYDLYMEDLAAALLIKSVEGSAFLCGEWTFFIGKDGKYYRYKTAGGSVLDPIVVTQAEYAAAKASTTPGTSGGSPADGQPPAKTVMRATLCGEWMYCIGSDGKYYRYLAVGGSFENALIISKEAYDAALNPPAEEGIPVFVWVLIGAGGAVVLMGGGALVAVMMIKSGAKKNKAESTKEEDSKE